MTGGDGPVYRTESSSVLHRTGLGDHPAREVLFGLEPAADRAITYFYGQLFAGSPALRAALLDTLQRWVATVTDRQMRGPDLAVLTVAPRPAAGVPARAARRRADPALAAAVAQLLRRGRASAGRGAAAARPGHPGRWSSTPDPGTRCCSARPRAR